jgi:hypothetical protein
MRSLLSFLFIFLIISSVSYSQRILLDENFENSGLTPPDSMPTNWVAINQDNGGGADRETWECRDSGVVYPAGSNVLYKTMSYNSKRSLTIGWVAGDPVADDWAFTPIVNVQTGDSLIFYMILGSPILPESQLDGGMTGKNSLDGGPPYIDTMQVWVCVDQDPSAAVMKLQTIRSLDSNNVFTRYAFDLSAFNGQAVSIAFRYYMNTTADGLLCYIDNVFIGNHSTIGIQQIGTQVPSNFELKQNYPNPFNPTTNIEFSIVKAGHVELVIFNALGQQVSTLVNQDMKPGSYKYDFNASGLPSGTYYYRLTSGENVQTNKMILVK